MSHDRRTCECFGMGDLVQTYVFLTVDGILDITADDKMSCEESVSTQFALLVPKRHTVSHLAASLRDSCFSIVWSTVHMAGKIRCIDAFVVTLSQACEGGEKRWCESTLELQLASREMCSACRSIPTLLVRVDGRTPRALWSRQPQTLSIKSISEDRLLSRVPSLRALSLVWDLPVEVLFDEAATELWESSKCVQLGGSISTGSLNSAAWPKGLQHLVLDVETWLGPVMADYVRWPPMLKRLTRRLSFGYRFNQPIVGVMWPASLQQLSFGELCDRRPLYRDLGMEVCFNQPVIGVVWPASLQKLSFGDYFRQPIIGIAWPASLQQLSFGNHFNQPIAGVVWPASLQQLSFGFNFNQPIAGVVWPASLQQLSFGYSFNCPIHLGLWPTSLQQLSFGNCFNQPIAGVAWPTSLLHFSVGDFFNQPIVGVAWPTSLQKLSFGECFDQPIVGIAWPACLLHLSLGDDFNQPIVGVEWPATLQQLSFGNCFNQPIVGVAWPASLLQLSLGYTYSSSRSETASTSPCWELYGRPLFSGYRLEGSATSPSSE